MENHSKPFFTVLVHLVFLVVVAGCATGDTPTTRVTPTAYVPDTISPATSTPEVSPTSLPADTARPVAYPDLVAFVGDNGRGGSTLWLIDEEGKDLYTPFPEIDRAGDLQWSAQGSWLGFTFTQGDQQGLMLFNPFEYQERLVPDSSSAIWHWSADGSQLAFFASRQGGCQLGIYSLPDASIRLLSAMQFDIPCNHAELSVIWITDWTSDGRYLFFDAGTGGNRGLTVIDVIDDGVVIELASIAYTSAKISPDGASLALDLTAGSEPNLHDPSVTIIDIFTGEQRQVTSGVIFEDQYRILDWLPDGRILYLWWHQTADSYWYFNPQSDQTPVPAEDYQPPLITNDTIRAFLPEGLQLRSYSLSPDSTRACVGVADGEKSVIYFLDLETGTLSPPVSDGGSPQWQPVSREGLGAAVVATATGSPTATSSPTPTPTPESVALESMGMFFWDVWFSYDPDVWQPGGNQYMPSITHRVIPQCIIQEQGPTEPPTVTRELDLGDIHYGVAELVRYGSHVDWYMAVYGPNGPFAGGLPTLIVTGAPEQWDTCLADAWIVLATLTDIYPGPSSSGQGDPFAGSDFTCEGALAPRLWIDGYAFVSYDPPLSNRVRTGPGTNYPVVGTIPPGEVVRVIDGPSCANGWVWWKIRTVASGLTGWTVEGDAPDYWLIPCASADDCGQ